MADSIPIPGLGGISGDPRQGGNRLPTRSRPGPALERKAGAPPAPADEVQTAAPTSDPTTALIQALDRLRATQELRPVEVEMVRALRGARHYQDEDSRHDLPLLDDLPDGDLPGLPPDQVG